jgi:hypothetical protein
VWQLPWPLVLQMLAGVGAGLHHLVRTHTRARAHTRLIHTRQYVALRTHFAPRFGCTQRAVDCGVGTFGELVCSVSTFVCVHCNTLAKRVLTCVVSQITDFGLSARVLDTDDHRQVCGAPVNCLSTPTTMLRSGRIFSRTVQAHGARVSRAQSV